MVDHSERAKQLILGSLRAAVRGYDPSSTAPTDARADLAWFCEVERLAAAGKTLAAAAAIADEPWLKTGERSAEAWLAKRIDGAIGDARAVLGTAARLADAPATDEAFRAGALTVPKAEAITSAVSVAPASEAQLLETASRCSLKRVRDDAAKVRALADPDPEATHARIHQNRTWRRWNEADGSRCGSYRLTPEQAAILEAAAQPFIDEAIDAARRSGSGDAYDALAADGLVAMAANQLDDDAYDALVADDPDTSDADTSDSDGDGPADRGDAAASTRPPRGARGRKRLRNRRELIAIVHLGALRRGHTEPGETCEIAGVGPVPVSVAREVFGDALLRIVIRDGVNVVTVVHTGRTASAVQETAILIQQDGRCGHPDCDQPACEVDHRTGYPRTGAVTLDELLGLCGLHHDLKTNHGHTWRREADGTITWIPPPDTG